MPGADGDCGLDAAHTRDGEYVEAVMGALDDDRAGTIVPPAVQRRAARLAIEMGRTVLEMRRKGRGATAIMHAVGCRHTQTLVRLARLRQVDALLSRRDGQGLLGMTLTQAEMCADVRDFEGRVKDVFRVPQAASLVLAAAGDVAPVGGVR